MEYENELPDFMNRRFKFLSTRVNFVFLGGLKSNLLIIFGAKQNQLPSIQPYRSPDLLHSER